MQGTRMRERSRSPLSNRDDFDDEQEDTGRYDKNHLDSKKDNSERGHRSNSRDSERDQRPTGRYGNSVGKIYVGNLPYQYRWQDVKDLLKTEVGMVNYVETFDDEHNKPRGCAVVQFQTQKLYDLAMQSIPELEVKGRRLRCFNKDDASQSRDFKFLFHPTSGNRRSVLERLHSRNQKQTPPLTRVDDNICDYGETYGLSISFLKSLNITGPLTNRIFVANIDFSVENSDLEKVFKMAGPVVKAEISKDARTGKSRGMAVVEFEHPIHAVQAISMFHNQMYYERELCVRMDREFVKPVVRNNLPPGLKGIGVGLGINGSALIETSAIRAMNSDGRDSSSMQGSNMQMDNVNSNNFNQMGIPMTENSMGMVSSGGMPMNNSFGNSSIQQDSFCNIDQQRQMGMMSQGSFGQNMNPGMGVDMYHGMGQNMNRGMPSDMNRGMSSDMNRGIPSDMNRGMPSDINRGMPSDLNRGMVQDMNRGMGQDMNRGIHSDLNRGMGQDMIRGMSSDMNRGMPSNINRGMSSEINRGMPSNINRTMPSDMNRGINPDMNRGINPVDINQGMMGNNMNSFGSEGIRDDLRNISGFGANGGGRGNENAGMNKDPGSAGGFEGRFGMGNNPKLQFDNRSGSNSGLKGSSSSTSSFGGSRRLEQPRSAHMPTVVHITNLPTDYTWQNLRNLCSDYGEVKFAEITGEGVGVVRFQNEASAITASELLDRQRFDGKLLSAEIM